MPTSTPGPRELLKRIRAIMAESQGQDSDAESRLNTITTDIARNMRAEVCSVYVLRADRELELFATEGLNPEAVHKSTLTIGEGLVGLIASSARSLNLPDAQKHPAFQYLPETGEELYSSFMGVPILRAGRVLGVLTVQNVDPRIYADVELEAMETIAMVLAEMIGAGELLAIDRNGTTLDLESSINVTGASFSAGIGMGQIFLHEPRVVVSQLVGEDVDTEIARLHEALDALRLSIDDMISSDAMRADGDHREVLEAYRMFANDRGWVRRIEEQIRSGLSAEGAAEKVQSDNRARMMRSSDPYLRERMHDFDDLAYRLLRQLTGRDHVMPSDIEGKDAIVVARNMGAAELLDYRGSSLRGLVLEDGTPTSHAVIVAKAMGIPVVGRARGLNSLVKNGDPVIIDGDEGTIYLRPAQDLEAAYSEKVQFRAARQARYRELKDTPAISLDGDHVRLNMNAGLVFDLPQLAESGADGIGLFRTELQFMVSSTLPRGDAQQRLYREVVEAAGDKPVTFRTLDIGGDKVLPYLKQTAEENPALGMRAMRIALDRPGLLKAQLRSLLKAAAGRELRVMLPMVTLLSEVDAVRRILDAEVRHLTRHGHELPNIIRLGLMVEVPALLWQLEDLMETVDFVSVGSNDLFQFIMAVDRGNAALMGRYDELSRPFLRVLKKVADVANRTDTELNLCGEMAGKPLNAMALLALGYRSISMSPASVGPVKAMVQSLNIEALRRELLPHLDAGRFDEVTIRELLEDFAAHNGVALD
ncbi:MAG: phosphoenolpyruvate--protein phosphotransferase [Pseudomonadota bacterium]